MAHVIKDSMNHYGIEIKRGHAWAQLVFRVDGVVEFKKLPLEKPIKDDAYHSADGTYSYDDRWQEAPDVELSKVIDSFLNAGHEVTDKARRMLEALKADPKATDPLPSTEDHSTDREGDTKMSTTKTTKKSVTKKAAPKSKKAKATTPKKAPAKKGYKGHRAGSRKEKAHKFFDDKKPTREQYIAFCKKLDIKESTASSWYQAMKK